MKIKSLNGEILYSSNYNSVQDALENGIKEGVIFDGADLSGLNLTKANLDGLRMKNGSFKSSNLTGANLSECVLDHCDFSLALLYDTCFCESYLKHCRFNEARFGDTDFSYSTLDYSKFSGLSFKNIFFNKTVSYSDCVYLADGKETLFSDNLETFKKSIAMPTLKDKKKNDQVIDMTHINAT